MFKTTIAIIRNQLKGMENQISELSKTLDWFIQGKSELLEEQDDLENTFF